EFLKKLSLNHPTIMYSTLRGFDKIKPVLKAEFRRKSEMRECINCGEPAAHELCRACIFSKGLKSE
ncbi:MAG: tRNA lysidine(34) synthetase TilS, partial [Euryarchaeota archaeon]|nr:tRNA lysidine(34) synthetase TilS [Euryarchaeota archaeon]